MGNVVSYGDFLSRKVQLQGDFGFEVLWWCDALKDFQAHLVEWALRKGRAAIYADCGLGKTLMQLVWAENVARHTGLPVLVLTPLAVSAQTVMEAAKFGIEAERCQDGRVRPGARIVVTNYERLHYFDAGEFGGCVCDEAGILKNFDGRTKATVVDFMRKMRYRLLCTATPAPNDFVEIGNCSEALGDLGYMDMLSKFFKNDTNTNHPNHLRCGGAKWRFRGHSEGDFWRWMCSWARAARKPSDLGFSDAGYDLPALLLTEHVVPGGFTGEELLVGRRAGTLQEQARERRKTVAARCEKTAEVLEGADGPAVAWCHLNDEGDLLQRLIPGSVQVKGSDRDERKEEVFLAFQRGEVDRLITKTTIAGFGMNWQHCAHQTYFPSHSFEQWYQGIRRSWRFGQTRDVRVGIVTSEGEMGVLENLRRKAANADLLFQSLIECMNNELRIEQVERMNVRVEVPSWV